MSFPDIQITMDPGDLSEEEQVERQASSLSGRLLSNVLQVAPPVAPLKKSSPASTAPRPERNATESPNSRYSLPDS